MSTQSTDSEIGAYIRQRRVALGISQADLSAQLQAAEVNWSQGTLSKVEKGERPVRLSESRALAKVMGIAWYELLRPPNAINDARARISTELTKVMRELKNLEDKATAHRITKDGLEALAAAMNGKVVYAGSANSFVPAAFMALTVSEVVAILTQLGATDEELSPLLPSGFTNNPTVRSSRAEDEFLKSCVSLFERLAPNFTYGSGKGRFWSIEGVEYPTEEKTWKEHFGASSEA